MLKNELNHNQDHQVDRIGNYLEGKSIALCVSGGIASIEAPKIARHLRRYGAEVEIYATNSALKFVGEAALEWGAGRKTITELTGGAEHISYHDLVLVAPATLNTINKIFSGIADNNVMTLIASALGNKTPVYLAPTMHESLYNNPILQHNLSFNSYNYGIKVIEPRNGEGKKKMPDLESIASQVSRELSQDPLKGKKILITGGPTPVMIDDVRMITNIFKGTLGLKIAKEAYFRGLDVKLLLGSRGVKAPSYIDTTYHSNYDEYYETVMSNLNSRFDIGVFSAAVADYKPKEKAAGKIPSGGLLKSIELTTTKKVIQDVRKRFPKLFMATFKLEDGSTSKDELMKIVNDRLQFGYQLVVANTTADVSEKAHKAFIVSKEGILAEPESKEEIASELLNKIGAGYSNHAEIAKSTQQDPHREEFDAWSKHHPYEATGGFYDLKAFQRRVEERKQWKRENKGEIYGK